MAATEIGQLGLLERQRELSILSGLLDSIEGGSGGVVVIRGPAGIGKSALVSAVRLEARRRGVRSFSARGEEIEREFGFGVARQLFEKAARERLAARELSGAAELALRPLGISAGAQPSLNDVFAARHGLYWLVADLASEGPMLLSIDEAQWADSASIEWTAFLAGRLDELAIGLVLAVRDEDAFERALGKIEMEPAAHLIVPRPLSKAAVGQMTKTVFGEQLSPDLVKDVYDATGGNPLWTREILRALASHEIPVHSVDALRMEQTTPLSVTRAVLVRLGQLGDHAVDFARAIAVLGSDVELADAAAVASLDLPEANRIASLLERAGLLAPELDRLTFTHPIVREAVYADVSAVQRAEAHARTAARLAERHAQPELIAMHRLHVPPAGDHRVVNELRRAAGAALARGAPGTALPYLRRACEERADGPDAELLHELGTAEALTSDPGALEHLLAAYHLAERHNQPRFAVDASQAMLSRLLVDEAVELLQRTLRDIGDSDRENHLRVNAALVMTRFFGGTVEPLRADLPSGATPGERALLSALVPTMLVRAAEPDAALDLARAAWSDGRLLDEAGPDSPSVLGAVAGPLGSDRFEEGTAWLSAVIAEAQRRGSITGFHAAVALRGYVHYRSGNIGEAVADARAGMAAESVASEAKMTSPMAVVFLIDALIETGDLDEADAALATHGWDGWLPDVYVFDVLRDRRGRLRVAQGRIAEGADDLLDARRRLSWIENPTVNANLDSHAAMALAALGRRDEARELVADEVERAGRVGLPRQMAVALRAAALIEEPADVERLRESAELAAKAGVGLEHARALTDLGAALRRGGHPKAAREPLSQALSLGTGSGAPVVSARARQELLAAGGRPRRPMLTGRDALTPSEQRIAQLAAAGQSNREIAQGLFVTVRTVEMHLSASYRKLNITSRSDLPAALALTAPA